MKKRLMSFFAVMLIYFGIAIPVNAQRFEDANETIEIQKISESDVSYNVFAIQIEYKFRYNNRVRQYRRWNASYGFWIDPYWINI